MRACLRSSAPAQLLTPEPSRWLRCWWLALHILIGSALWLALGVPGLLALPVLIGHLILRWPPAGPTLMVCDRVSFCLPLEGRFGLRLMAESRSGPGWIRLVFSDRPGVGVQILRDQLDSAGWRCLQLALRESD